MVRKPVWNRSGEGASPRDFGIMTLAIMLSATGVYFFKFPNNFSTGGVTGIALNLDSDSIGAVLMGPDTGIKAGDPVRLTGDGWSVDLRRADGAVVGFSGTGGALPLSEPVPLWSLAGEEGISLTPGAASWAETAEGLRATWDQPTALVSAELRPAAVGLEITIRVTSREGTWLARADRAWVDAGGTELRLIGAVALDSPPEGGSGELAFRSERLDVFPRERKVQSDAVVTLTSRDSILRGRGLRADLDTRRFQLLDEVTGHYASPVSTPRR